jgi:hypothetical protein
LTAAELKCRCSRDIDGGDRHAGVYYQWGLGSLAVVEQLAGQVARPSRASAGHNGGRHHRRRHAQAELEEVIAERARERGIEPEEAELAT